MTSVMRKPLGGVAVVVEHLSNAQWSIAGDEAPTAAHVDVIIGRGTNSAAEKARFMAGMMTTLRAVFGPGLRDETYIVLREIETESYGRGGISRAECDRRAEAALPAAAR